MLDKVGSAVAATAPRGQAAAAEGTRLLDYPPSVGCAGVGGGSGDDVERFADSGIAVGAGGNDGVREGGGGGGQAAGGLVSCGFAARDAPPYYTPVGIILVLRHPVSRVGAALAAVWQ